MSDLIGPEIKTLALPRICTVGDVIVIEAGVITIELAPHVRVISAELVIEIGPPAVVDWETPTVVE